MKTINELIDILKNSNTEDQMIEVFEDDIKDIIYYLEAYQDFVDGIMNIIHENKDMLKIILQDMD